jgi:hypothetical protein
MAITAPTTSSLRSSERASHQLGWVTGAREARGKDFFRLGVAFGAFLAREGDFPFFFTRDFDLLDEAKYRVLIGMAIYSSIAQMVCFSF